ncbi:MAG: MerR family transcriptional regulator [Peptostreptococcaceae bacterium]
MSNRRFYTKEQMFLYRDESEKYIDKKDNKLYKLCDFSNIIKVSTAALNTWSKKGILVPFNSSTNGKYYTNEHLMKYYCLDKYEDLNLVEKTYSVSEFSEMIGITKRNLQYWDNIGKMQVNRTITGTKYYTHEQFKDYQNSKIDMYRPRDLAKILNVPVKTIDNWDKVGFIKSNKTISGRKYYTYTAVQEIKSKIENKKNRDIK